MYLMTQSNRLTKYSSFLLMKAGSAAWKMQRSTTTERRLLAWCENSNHNPLSMNTFLKFMPVRHSDYDRRLVSWFA